MYTEGFPLFKDWLVAKQTEMNNTYVPPLKEDPLGVRNEIVVMHWIGLGQKGGF